VNSGASFTTISSVSNCAAVGLGKAEPSSSYHTLYIWGTVGGVTGVFRSIDQGATWLRINDDAHEYGGPGNGQFVIGDMNVYGRVYMSTVGRGIVYGDIEVAAPVSLLSFSLIKEEPNHVQLHWQTASELNNDHFSIERSSNGSNYEEIGLVKGAGNSSALLSYTFTDVQPLAGQNYYRLKQVDVDGTASYSEIKNINLLHSNDASLYPNPVENQLTIVAPLIESIEINDVLGRVVLQQKNLSLPELTLDLDALPGGLYWVRIRSGSDSIVKCFLKK
jgi:hypothetical protein